MTFTTRFAPSPTGPLHLGHAYSALLAFDLARAAGGRFLLRIEDIDRERSKPQWEDQIYDDLTWLGIEWDEPVMRQSGRLSTYSDALDALWARDLLFPCTCTRRDIQSAMSAPQEGAPMGPDGLIYPGTCDPAPQARFCDQPRPTDRHLRLRMARAIKPAAVQTAPIRFEEQGKAPAGQIETSPEHLIHGIGDVVLSRRDMGTSYHLSVVLDDADQGITHVVRGKDLFDATAIHVVLQRLLDLPTPVYHHHDLIRDDRGKRLAKRDDARAIAKFRAEGASPADIRALVGLQPAPASSR